MPFQKHTVVKFKGLNSTIAPELIEDGEARDILNLRQEKVGKLVTRKGAKLGLYGHFEDLGTYQPDSHNDLNSDIYISSIRGIGEMILEHTDAGTDRYILYYVTCTSTESVEDDTSFCALIAAIPNTSVTIDGEVYLLDSWVPMSNGIRKAAYVDGDSLRELSELASKSDWSKALVKMSQYKHQVIVSDPINGDFRVKQEPTLVLQESCDEPTYRIVYEENTLGSFDIDAVKIGYELEAGEENESVETGMALYKFQAAKGVGRTSVDHNDESIGYADTYDSLEDLNLVRSFAASNLRDARNNPSKSTFVKGAHFSSDISGGNPMDYYGNGSVLVVQDMVVNENLEYRFTNLSDRTELDLLNAPLEFASEDVEVDGVTRALYSADPYIWEDVKLTYYPCSGVDSDGDGSPDEECLLRGIDQDWDKLTPVVPKAYPLTKHEGAAAQVPLGVWKYRYVWDFGDGNYSAPSAELTVGDILWSATPDSEFASGEYERKLELKDDKLLGSVADLTALPIFQASPATSLTEFGKCWFKLKDAVYGEDHLWGSQITYPTTEAAVETAFSAATNEQLSRLTAACNVVASDGDAILDGVVAQWVDCDASPANVYNSQLAVPLFGGSRRTQLNSVFSESGRYRVGFTTPSYNLTDRDGNVLTLEDARYHAELIFGGLNSPMVNYIINDIADPDYTVRSVNLHGTIASFGAANQDPVYVTFPRETTSFPYLDRLNHPEEEFDGGRPDTWMRAIREGDEPLSLTKPGVPPQVVDRLIVNGHVKLPIIAEGDRVIFSSEELGVTRSGLDIKENPWTLERRENDAYFYRGNSHVCRLIDEGGGTVDWVLDQDWATNLAVDLYLEGVRFTGYEQLTAYFPSSILFSAPRVNHVIAAANIPRRAKRLLVFRTLSSINNSYDPNSFGLVDTIDIERDTVTDDITGGQVEFFDDVKDSKIDFGVTPDEFEGLREPIKSRYNTPLNERVYYANYDETYQQIAPRGEVADA